MQDWIVDAVRSLGVVGIALLMLLENVIPPLPSEFIMPLAGYLSARDDFSFWGAIAAGSIGSLLGTFLWYLLGRRVSEARVHGWVEAHGAWLTLAPEDVDRAKHFFDKHGEASVLFGRLLPVVRTLISVPAGFSRMPVARFLFFSMLGTLIWTAALAYAGLLLGRRFPQVGEYLGVITWVIIAGAAVVYIVRLVRLVRRKRAG